MASFIQDKIKQRNKGENEYEENGMDNALYLVVDNASTC